MSVRRREYKLHYFNSKGRAEVSRLMLAYAKVPYEDIRYSQTEWPEVKPKMPFGQLPVLEWKGQLLPQTNAIERLIARRHGLVGKNEWEEAQIDAYIALIYDTFEKANPIYTVRDDLQKMKEAIDHFTKTEAEPLLQRLEQTLIDNGTGFLIGNKLSWVDFLIFYASDIFSAWGVGDTLMATKPHVKKLCYTIGDLPAISDWIKKRPITPM